MRLGRLPHDPHRLAQARALRYGAVLPPARIIRDRSWSPTLGCNDTLPDCTAVAVANGARMFSRCNASTDVAIPDAAIIGFYADCIGQPGASSEQLAATNGAIMLDVMERQQANGFAIGGQVPLVADFAAIPPGDRYGLATAIARCGHVQLGVALAIADQTDGTWDTTTSGDQQPGSWGGHALVAYAYEGLGDTDIVWLATWGQWQAATWRWISARLEEAYALAWRQLLGPGMSYDALIAGENWV
jgi:hypothetical protein